MSAVKSQHGQTETMPSRAHATHEIHDLQDSQRNTKRNSESRALLWTHPQVDFEEDKQEISRRALALPLSEYLELVLKSSESSAEAREYPEYQTPAFYFARFSKAHPSLTNLPDHLAAQEVERAMRSWDDLPPGRNPWEHYFPAAESGDAAQLDFMKSWGAIRHIPFRTVLQDALRLAEQKPFLPPIKRVGLYVRFVSLAYWLQVLMGEKPILLPVRTVAKELKCDPATVSRLRDFAVADGLLTIEKRHVFQTQGKRAATEFRFNVDLCTEEEI